jgi:hypothetical protein
MAWLNTAAATWWHSSATSIPQSSKVDAGYLRLTRVWSMAMTTSPEVSHTSPCTRVTRAPGRNCATRSAHWSARKDLCTMTSTRRLITEARYSAMVVLPNPGGQHSIAPRTVLWLWPPWPQVFSTASTASGWWRSGRSRPLNVNSKDLPGGRASWRGGPRAATAQCRGATTVALLESSAYTRNFLGKGSFRDTGATVSSRRARATAALSVISAPRRVTTYI